MRPKIHLVLDWAKRCFGTVHVHNPKVRALRLVEEAIEVAQAFDVDADKLHKIITVVYSREKGQWEQEIGGVMMTAAVLAGARFYDIEDLFDREIRRVFSKPAEHFALRNQEKNGLGLTGD